MTPDLFVCIRCHEDPTLVLDTYDAAMEYTDRKQTLVFCSVDGNQALAERLMACNVPTYCSKQRHGWGAGLFELLMKTVHWATDRFGSAHFLSIDYDTLFLNPGVDDYYLDAVDDIDIGIAGKYIGQNKHWEKTFYREKARIEQRFGPVPTTYLPGEGVQGGGFMMTVSMIEALRGSGFMRSPNRDIRTYTTMADDHFAALICRYLNLDIVDVGPKVHCSWKAYRDPRGVEKKGAIVFHPIKIVNAYGPYSRSTDIEMRNYFRTLRGKEPLSDV